MEWPPASGWPKGFGVACAALLTASLLSFHPFDPTIFSLLSPPGGVRNWLGLPGALLGGSLVEAFGTASLLAPLLIAMWSLGSRGRQVLGNWALGHYAGHGAVALLLASALHGLGGGVPAPELWGPGLVGWAAAEYIRATVGPWLGALLLAVGLGYSATRLIYGVDWAARGREARTFLRYAWGRGATAGESIAAAGVGGAVGTARGIESLIAGLGGGIHGLWRGLWTRAGNAVGALTVLGRGGLPGRGGHGTRRARGARGVPAWQAPPEIDAPLAPARGAPDRAADGLDAWFGEFARGSGEPGPADPPLAGPALQPPAVPETPVDDALLDAAGDAWDRAARHYAENLDLDWEAKVYRARQAERPLADWDDDDPQEETG